ncbi:DMT family transporter [Aneurinibacillus migulanus]|uniref:DMT family transporter n=1 Tax=Aneurinibacillus migulanus TaxID=47500 RepID=UPI003B9729C1
MNKATALLWVAVILWGVAIAPTKWALESFSPLLLMFFRLLFSGILFAPYVLRKKKLKGMSIPWLRLFILSFTGVAGYFMLTSSGISLTSGTHASIIDASLPLFIILFAALYLKEKVTYMQWIGLAIGIFGVLLISLLMQNAGTLEMNGSSFIGDMLILASTWLFAFYTIQMKRPQAEAKLPSEAFTALTLSLGAIIVFPFALVEVFVYGWPEHITAKSWWSLCFLVIGPSIMAYWCWNKALEKVSGATSGFYMNMLPLISILASIVLLQEQMTVRILIGGAFVLLGVGIAEKASRSQQKEALCNLISE